MKGIRMRKVRVGRRGKSFAVDLTGTFGVGPDQNCGENARTTKRQVLPRGTCCPSIGDTPGIRRNIFGVDNLVTHEIVALVKEMSPLCFFSRQSCRYVASSDQMKSGDCDLHVYRIHRELFAQCSEIQCK